jgi:hypothetical protein
MAAQPAPRHDPQAVLENFVAGLPQDREALVRRLHATILAAHPEFDVDIKYGLLVYAIAGDWRRWVVSVDAHPKRGVSLRFLFGVMMADRAAVLRAGSSVLMSWDLDPGAEVNAAAVGSYVAEAVGLYPEYKANEQEILDRARAGARARERAQARPGQG